MKKQKTTTGLFLFAAILLIISCSNGTNDIASIKISSQTWAKKNLDVATFRNGDPIPEAKTIEEWIKSGKENKPAWCYYNDKPTLGDFYGRLYNWYAVNDPRGLAPEGWHVPSDAEWTSLTDFLGSEASYMLKFTSGWDKKRNGNNKSGFKALPGGFRNNDGTFSNFGSYSSWWSSTEYSDSSALIRYIGSIDTRVHGGDANMLGGYSVRCLQDYGVKENLSQESDNQASVTKKPELFTVVSGKFIPDTRFWHLVFSAPTLSESQINRITKSFEQKELFDNELLMLFYPEERRQELFDIGNIPKEMAGFKAISYHKVGDGLLFHYEFDYSEVEGIEGKREVIRFLKDKQWKSEISFMTGIESGDGLPVKHSGDVEWMVDGFLIHVEDVTLYPGLYQCMNGAQQELEMKCESGKSTTAAFTVLPELKLSNIKHENVQRLIPAEGLESKLRGGKNIEDVMKDNVALSDEDKFTLRNELYRIRQRVSGVKPDYEIISSPDSILENIVRSLAKEYKTGTIKFEKVLEVDKVTIYQLKGEKNFEFILAFNTLNSFFSGKDNHSLVLDQIRKSGHPHVSLLGGTIADIKDVNGDGKNEFIVNDLSNTNTFSSGSEDVFYLNEFMELEKADIPASSDFEGGICEHLKGRFSKVSFQNDLIVVDDEWGSDNCENQQYYTYQRKYSWDKDKKRFVCQ